MQSGIFKFTRNPIYLGNVLILVGLYFDGVHRLYCLWHQFCSGCLKSDLLCLRKIGCVVNSSRISMAIQKILAFVCKLRLKIYYTPSPWASDFWIDVLIKCDSDVCMIRSNFSPLQTALNSCCAWSVSVRITGLRGGRMRFCCWMMRCHVPKSQRFCFWTTTRCAAGTSNIWLRTWRPSPTMVGKAGSREWRLLKRRI